MAIMFRRPWPVPRALAVQTRYKDPDAVLSRGHRHLFVVPWRDRTMIGVNSKVWREDPNGLGVPEAEVAGFLDEIREAAPWLGFTRDDVAMVYAGLLPFGQNDKGAVDLSFGKRSHVIDHRTVEGLEGLISAISVRLTTARGVAEQVTDLVFRKRGSEPPRCETEDTRLSGASFGTFRDLVAKVAATPEVGGNARVAESLAHNHGSRFEDVLRIAHDRPELAGPVDGTSTLRAEIVHAVREEMACTLEDVLLRRTELATGGDPGEAAISAAADLAGAELGWSSERRRDEIARVRRWFPAQGGLAFTP
jgi:glycerol-3-phosphate dehydrogenase